MVCYFPTISHAAEIDVITNGTHDGYTKSATDTIKPAPNGDIAPFQVSNGNSVTVTNGRDIDLSNAAYLAYLDNGTLSLTGAIKEDGSLPTIKLNKSDFSIGRMYGDDAALTLENYHIEMVDDGKFYGRHHGLFVNQNNTRKLYKEIRLTNVSGNDIFDRLVFNIKTTIKNTKSNVIEGTVANNNAHGDDFIVAPSFDITGGTYKITNVNKFATQGTVVQAGSSTDTSFKINDATFIAKDTENVINISNGTPPQGVPLPSPSATPVTIDFKIKDSRVEYNNTYADEKNYDNKPKLNSAIQVAHKNVKLEIDNSTIKTNLEKDAAFNIVNTNNGLSVNDNKTEVELKNNTVIDARTAIRVMDDATNDVMFNLDGAKFSTPDETDPQKTRETNILITGPDTPNNVVINATGKSELVGAIEKFEHLKELNLDNSSWKVKNNPNPNGETKDPDNPIEASRVRKLSMTNGANLTFAEKDTKLIVEESLENANGRFTFNTTLDTTGENPTDNKLVFNNDVSGMFEINLVNNGSRSFKEANTKEIIRIKGRNNAIFRLSERRLSGAYELFVKNCSIGVCFDVQERVESTIYASNTEVANTLFNLRLHDRQGDVFMQNHENKRVWMRAFQGKNEQSLVDSANSVNAKRTGVQLGGDVWAWRNGEGEAQVGVMAGYAKNKSDAINNETNMTANGTVKGYSLGVYGTWYQNKADRSGAYVDSWLQYNWFKNSVTSEKFAESYHTKGFNASLEAGYNFLVADKTTESGNQYRFYVQPQAQFVYMGVKGTHTESNGTQIETLGHGNIQTRAGVKTYLNAKLANGVEIQPFLEVNMLRNSKAFGVKMDDDTRMLAKQRIVETKAGVDVKINNNVKLWASFANQSGKQGYKDKQGLFGVKVEF